AKTVAADNRVVDVGRISGGRRVGRDDCATDGKGEEAVLEIERAAAIGQVAAAADSSNSVATGKWAGASAASHPAQHSAVGERAVRRGEQMGAVNIPSPRPPPVSSSPALRAAVASVSAVAARDAVAEE